MRIHGNCARARLKIARAYDAIELDKAYLSNIPEPYLKCDGHQSTITKRKTRIVVIAKWSDNVCGVVLR